MFVFPVGSLFRPRVSHHLDHATFPASAASNAACGFPALRSPVCFASRLMGPILPEPLSARVVQRVAVEEAQLVVHPLPIPPLPIEAPTIPSALHMAPDLLFHPVFDEAEALAGMSDREVIHPPT